MKFLVLLLLFAACGTRELCGPHNCSTGCCDQAGRCITVLSASACGIEGASCASCAASLLCVDGVCRPGLVDTGGGTATGGGSATGGGAATGGGSTTGGGAAVGGGAAAGGGAASGGGAATGGGAGAGGGAGTGGGTATGGGTGSAGGVAGEALTAHNLVRANALPTPTPALPALTWNAAAVAVAQQWANGCHFAHNAGRGSYGENLFASTANDTITTAVTNWAGEASNYTYATNSCSGVCGHYTQIVWRNTTSVGCASARCTTNTPFPAFPTWYFWVCDYAPPGNVVGQRPW